eukprot:GHVH01006411.1.p1 GENE.GHVH01006411.1~~GHVH01006411.1.p1  ORF type:complete len:426 (+),score=79.30 GHVH01006411.1:92-1369(+)
MSCDKIQSELDVLTLELESTSKLYATSKNDLASCTADRKELKTRMTGECDHLVELAVAKSDASLAAQHRREMDAVKVESNCDGLQAEVDQLGHDFEVQSKISATNKNDLDSCVSDRKELKNRMTEECSIYTAKSLEEQKISIDREKTDQIMGLMSELRKQAGSIVHLKEELAEMSNVSKCKNSDHTIDLDDFFSTRIAANVFESLPPVKAHVLHGVDVAQGARDTAGQYYNNIVKPTSKKLYRSASQTVSDTYKAKVSPLLSTVEEKVGYSYSDLESFLKGVVDPVQEKMAPLTDTASKYYQMSSSYLSSAVDSGHVKGRSLAMDVSSSSISPYLPTTNIEAIEAVFLLCFVYCFILCLHKMIKCSSAVFGIIWNLAFNLIFFLTAVVRKFCSLLTCGCFGKRRTKETKYMAKPKPSKGKKNARK